MKRIATIAVALLLLAGCTDDGPDRPDPEPAPDVTEAESPAETPGETPTEEVSDRTIPIQVWFVDRDIKLYPHHAEIPATMAVGRAALEALFAGVPDDAPAKTVTIVPDGTELLGLTIDKGTARVDLSSDFEDTGMGSAADGLQVAQVVYTLTQFPTVKRVEFLIEGEVIDVIGSHGIVLDGPQTRKDWESALPPIVVLSPYPGQELTPPIPMHGIANVFEATVSYRVRDDSGKIVDEGFVTATCGTGCYGTFAKAIQLDVDLPAEVVLEVFESSAEDGRPLHMQRIPLSLTAP